MRSSRRGLVPLCVALLGVGGACLGRGRKPEAALPPPTLTPAPPVLNAPIASRPVAAPVDTAPILDEERITLKTTAPTDAKLLLKYIADSAGYGLVLPPGAGPKIEIDLVNVPASLALRQVLERAGYTLAPARTVSVGFDTTVVFYMLPTNIDSLSVDAIVRRYGVSRAVAELIINARRR
jgi:hypothetical protein